MSEAGIYVWNEAGLSTKLLIEAFRRTRLPTPNPREASVSKLVLPNRCPSQSAEY